MRVVSFGVLALVVLTTAAKAQPTTDPLPPDAKGASGGTKIPVSMPDEREVLGAEHAGISYAPAPVSLEQPIDPNAYLCGPGDVFELNFWGQQNFRLRITADLEGRLFISKVGFVAVAGKNLTNVRALVGKKVRTNYPGLEFELALVSPRSFLVQIVDNVKVPGTYQAHPLERISTVVARAGGITGSKRRISIQHKNGGELTADLLLFEMTGDTSYDPYVLDGDVVRVPFADTTVDIEGAVHRPGTYELTKAKNTDELFELAGGLAGSVARSLPVRIVRRNAKDQEAFIDLNFDGQRVPTHQLQDGDRVIVRGVEDLQRTVLLIGAVTGADTVDPATTSRRLPFVEGDTVLSLVNRAGGIKAAGDLKRSYISRPQASGAPAVIPVDLDALIVHRDFAADKSIAMGDTIVVPPMQYSVLVEGAVGRPGLYPFNPAFGISEYIAHAGGRTRTARDLDESQVVDSSGSTRGFNKNLKPSPGDAILIPERNFTRAEVVQIVIAAAGLVLSGVAITIAATR